MSPTAVYWRPCPTRIPLKPWCCAVEGAFSIDYLVNNAAIYGVKLDLFVPLDYYKKFMSVNHDGVLVCTRAT